MTARIAAIAGPHDGSSFALGDETSIGRAPENTLALDDRSVSRKQCVIIETPSGYRIRDCGGVNPTRVNGVRVGEVALREGDRIEIGRSIFVLELESADPTEILDAGTDLEPTLSGEPAPPPDELGRLSADLAHPANATEFVGAVTAAIDRILLANRACLLRVNSAGELEGLTSTAAIVVAKRLVRQAIETRSAVAARATPQGAGTLAAMRISAAIVAPILQAREAIGVLYAERIEGVFAPDDLKRLTEVAAICAGPLDAFLRIRRLEEENRKLRALAPGLGPMIGNSAGMQQVYRTISRIAPTDSTVLILGESGTGKELIARALHSHSRRAAGPFVAINCAALPEALLESELFGHEKGAFTGATAVRKGLLEEASGGTFFFDEIGEMPLLLQAKLLRVLQERQFNRVGGSRPLTADIRVVAATNRNLDQCVRDRTFREDLLYRLKVIALRPPPLRERKDDLEALARHFLAKHAARGNPLVREITPEAIGLLRRYDWPGNVRELENAVERAVVLAETEELRPEDFADLTPSLEVDGVASATAGDWHERLLHAKRRIVQDVLRDAGGKQAEAARALGLHPNNLRRLMKQLGIPTAHSV